LITVYNFRLWSYKRPDTFFYLGKSRTDPNSDAVSYFFYYTDDSTWTSNVITSNEIANTAYTIPGTLTGGKWYWWRVKATDGYLTRLSSQNWSCGQFALPPLGFPRLARN